MTPSTRAGRREDREVAKAPVKHVEQHLARQAVSWHGLGRSRHRLEHGRLGREPDGEHPGAQVPVGEDAKRGAEVDDDRRRPAGRSSRGLPR